ncbi:MAG: hypothetical protein K0R18_1539 [Bacillales bacterium]|jgi:Rgg/GadR/MutR family transcriptional activator|nr:hypothetical protein [Bacillales bacterium]
MEIGETLRFIRVSKKFTQEEVSFDVMEHSAYARIERGETKNISSWRLNRILDKLNISFEEFWFIKSDFLPTEKEEIMNQIMGDYLKKDFLRLGELEKEIYEKYKKTSDIHFWFLSILAYCCSKDCAITEIDPIKTEPIVTYLYNQESWLRYEILLFINFMFAFDISVVLLLASRAMKKSDKFWSFHFNEGDPYLLLLLNLISFCIEKNRVHEAKKFYALAQDRLAGKNCLNERNRLHFYNGIILIKDGKKDEGKQICEETIRIVEILDLNPLANSYRVFLRKHLI